MPRRILAVAVEQWRTRNDTPFVRVLLAAGADLCQVDSVTEVAPIHQVRNKILEGFFAIPSARPSAYTIPNGPFREGGGPLTHHCDLTCLAQKKICHTNNFL